MMSGAKFFGLSAAVACAVLAAAAGCGSSTTDGSNANSAAGHAGASGSVSGGASGAVSAGAGGVAGAAGSSAGAGSGGGLELVLGDSKTEACIGYSVAQCVRRAECRGYAPDGCLEQSFGCPDSVFSEGSTRTVAGLKACVTDELAFPCEQFNLGQYPDCVTPGTRKAGEACAFSSQCASLECHYTARAGCATCATVLPLGGDCTAPNTACGYYESCQNGQCAPFTAIDNPLRSIGQDCSGDGISCGPGSYCALATMRCVAAPTLGMSCAASQTCADGYCSKATQTCTPQPGLNQPCGVDALPGPAGYCAVGLVCSGAAATGSCVPAPSAGQQCYSGAICEAASRCDFLQQPALCAKRNAAGTACADRSECESGLYCLCADGTDTCTTSTCNVVHLAGEACGAPGVVCHPGFSCTDGKCQPRDTQGVSASCANQ